MNLDRSIAPRLGRVLALLVLLLAGLPAARASRDDPPGTRYPAMKLSFFDPYTGRLVWRMTTDAKRSGASNEILDLASEVTSWSPDSRRIVYVKNHHPDKPDGVYIMDVETGAETLVARERSLVAVFSRATREVYYSVIVNGWPRHGASPPADAGSTDETYVQVRAVSLDDYSVRTVQRFPGAIWLGPAVQNCDGSFIALFPMTGSLTGTFDDMSEQCVIVNQRGEVHPGWEFNPAYVKAANADFAIWHPTDPKLLITRRFTGPTETRTCVWHIDKLAPHYPAARKIGHSAWHPNGKWFLEHHLFDLESGEVLKHLAIGSHHKSFNPLEGALGMKARLSFDAWRPPYMLFVRTLEELEINEGRWPAHLPDSGPVRQSELIRMYASQTADPSKGYCLHYSDFSSHAVHTHDHWSPDGRAILWQSNVAFTDWGAPPGGVSTTANAAAADLFVVPVASR